MAPAGGSALLACRLCFCAGCLVAHPLLTRALPALSASAGLPPCLPLACLPPSPRPCRNIFDAWLGTDNLGANVGSVAVGLAIILLFRLFKLPLAEFW